MSRRYYNPQVAGVDGSDHAYRMTVEDRYKVSARARRVLNASLIGFAGYGVVSGAMVLLSPFPGIEAKSQLALVLATALLPALLIYRAVNPKSFSTVLCIATRVVCYGCSLALLVIAGVALSMEATPTTVGLSVVLLLGMALNTFASRYVHVLESAAGHRKKR